MYSQNLRDFLRVEEEDHQRNLSQATSSSRDGGRLHSSGLTLSAIIGEKFGQPPPIDRQPLQRIQSNRTLLEIIREDQTAGLGHGREHIRSSWRHLRNKIRLRRRGGGFARSSALSGVLLNSSDSRRFNLNIDSGDYTRGHRSRATERSSGRFEQTNRRSTSENSHHYENEEGEERSGDAVEGELESDSSPEQPVRMSLLAENDRQNRFETSAYMMDEDGGSTAANGVAYNGCCVCMVRHKGAAFIPCGHTFCRLCSRELWVQRGNCPLCNNYIMEILDIF